MKILEEIFILLALLSIMLNLILIGSNVTLIKEKTDNFVETLGTIQKQLEKHR
jgi:hypothetical protein